MANPVSLTNTKAKVLAGALERRLGNADRPFVQALVFLSAPDASVESKNNADHLVVTQHNVVKALTDGVFPGTSERLAQDCVDLYQRASSCVEGRNGYLSLRHHQRHALSDEVLRALTVVHNYMLRRADGTTAAQRFFGHLCAVMPLPARPRRRATRPVKDPLAIAT